MRALFPLIFKALICCLAVLAGSYIFKKPGYFLFAYGDAYIETTLLTLLLVLIGLWLAERIIRVVAHKLWGLWGKREQNAKLALQQGLTAFLLNDWQRAEKLLSRSGKHSGLLQTKSMFAAMAADASGDEAKALAHLQALVPTDNDSVMVKTQLLLKQGEVDEALTLIKPLFDKKPRNNLLLGLYVSVLEAAQDWSTLLALLPRISKQKLYDEQKQSVFVAALVGKTLYQSAKTESFDAAHNQWQQIPTKFTKLTAVNAVYIGFLANHGQSQQAETLLIKSIKKGQVDDYLELLRQVSFDQPTALLAYLESGLKKDQDNWALLCALGHVAAGSGDHSLAAKALAKASQQTIDDADLIALANAYRLSGDDSRALAVYHQLYD